MAVAGTLRVAVVQLPTTMARVVTVVATRNRMLMEIRFRTATTRAQITPIRSLVHVAVETVTLMAITSALPLMSVMATLPKLVLEIAVVVSPRARAGPPTMDADQGIQRLESVVAASVPAVMATSRHPRSAMTKTARIRTVATMTAPSVETTATQ